MTTKNISSKTKAGDVVFDGCTRCFVTARIGDSLILRNERTGDFYSHEIGGASKRHLSEQDAIAAVVVPAVVAQVTIARAQGHC
jgi:hypothetical protein